MGRAFISGKNWPPDGTFVPFRRLFASLESRLAGNEMEQAKWQVKKRPDEVGKENGMNYIEELQNYQPQNAQEAADQETIFAYIRAFPDTVLTRENIFGHITGSSMIFNETGDRVLMIYHNIFRSWSWTGGHADGETDLYQTALREAREETGIETLERIGAGLASIDVIPVWGHVKRGKYVSAHQHLNFSYLLRAREEEPLRIKADENSQVGWLAVSRLKELVSEPDMLPIYTKLIEREKRWK